MFFEILEGVGEDGQRRHFTPVAGGDQRLSVEILCELNSFSEDGETRQQQHRLASS